MIKKFLQNLFKKFFYSIFINLYGSINESIDPKNNKCIKLDKIAIDKKFFYKIYEITNGRLYTDRIHDTAAIIENKIIKGPSFQLRTTNEGKIYDDDIDKNIVFTKGTPRILRKLNGNVLSLLTGGGGNNNYWHWLYNVLPRLKILREQHELSKIDYFLFPSLDQKFQNETLDNLNIPQRKRISSVKFRHLKADKLIIIDDPILVTGNATEDIQHIPIWVLEWLKSNFLKDKRSENKRRIYIDRSNSGITDKEDRFVINENEVRNYLIKNNFTPVKLHEISFNEQINIFNSAEFVVGLHGAGFANIVFCPPKTKIIEFRNISLLPVIENLAVNNNLNYYSITSKEKHDLKFPSQQGSIHIPISSLSKIIEK